MESTKHVLRLHRSRTMPRDRKRLQDIIIQGEWATTGGLAGRSFLLYDNGVDADERMLLRLLRMCVG